MVALAAARLRLVFCGTPEFAVPTLQAVLRAGYDIPLVLTQPDKPAGRGLEVKSGPVKRMADAEGIAVLQPRTLRTNEELRRQLEQLRPDGLVVVAYGRLIPPWLLELPPLGAVNLHGSLLPKYRGAAPIQWAVARGETETGVSTMQLDAGLDTGDVLLERRVPIGPDTLAADLFPRLAELGADLMVDTLDGLAAGTLRGQPQAHAEATLAPLLTREDGEVDFAAQAAATIYNRWRGFAPWPGLHSRFRGKRFLLHRVYPAEGSVGMSQLAPGELEIADSLIVGAAGGTRLVLEEVQLEGKARLSGTDFARGFQVRRGERLG